MEEIKQLLDGETTMFSLKIYSDRLLNLKRLCPDDGERINATGNMYFRKNVRHWYVEYLCHKDQEVIRSWSPDIDVLTKQIAKDVLGEENKEDE